MKIIAKDNYDRELYPDHILPTKHMSKEDVKIIVDILNKYEPEDSDTYWRGIEKGDSYMVIDKSCGQVVPEKWEG